VNNLHFVVIGLLVLILFPISESDEIGGNFFGENVTSSPKDSALIVITNLYEEPVVLVLGIDDYFVEVDRSGVPTQIAVDESKGEIVSSPVEPGERLSFNLSIHDGETVNKDWAIYKANEENPMKASLEFSEINDAYTFEAGKSYLIIVNTDSSLSIEEE
jgi:hypothetical protein